VAVDPKELREVAKAADAAADNIRSATEALSEQASVVASLTEAYKAFSSAEVTQQVVDLTSALRDLSPIADEVAKRTKSTSSSLRTMSKNVEGVDATVTTLTGRMKDLSSALLGLNKDAQDGMFDPKKIKDLNDDQSKMQKTLVSIHDTLKDMKDNVEGFGKGVIDSARSVKDLGNTQGMLNDMSDSILGTSDALKETKTSSEQTGSSLRGLETSLLAAAATGNTFTGALLGIATESKLGQRALKWLGNTASKPLTAGIGAAIGAVTGLTSGLMGIARATKTVGGFFANMIGWAFKLGAAIIAIPVRFLGGLVEMAASMNMGAAEYLRQIEEVRDKFGNFRVGQSQAIKEMQKSFAKTTETGLNAYRIYGYLHERLKMITELVEGLGATWGVFQDEFARDGFLQAKRIDEFRMGLGLSHEQLKSTLMMSKAMGKSAGGTLTDLTKHVKGYAKTLNISHKTLTRDIADALKDAGRFGGIAIQAIARASAYARALGHELKEIAGVLDAFETFDTAAEGAAKLAQSFGATVDAFKLVSAQSPDEMIQHLRDSFFAAGKSAENLTRQELKLLSQQTGLNEEVARSVFSMQNQGRSVDELKKKQEEQENAQVTQAKALRSLADDIKRLVKEMQPLKKSFVSMFIDGMKKGVMRSKEFLGLMFKIRRGLILTWREGFKLGRVIIGQVPALKKLFEGLHAFFDPSKYKNLAAKMRHILLDFFKGNGGVSDMLHKAQEAFTHFFNIQNPAAKKMIEGAKMIMKRVAAAIAEGITWVSQQLVVGLKYIAGLISGKNSGDLALAGTFGGQALGFLYDILKPVIDAVVDAAPLLLNALVDLIVVAGQRLWTEVKKDPVRGILITTAKYLATGLAIAIGTKMLMGMVAGAMTSLVVGGINKMITGPGSKAISSAGSSLASKSAKAASAMPKGGAALGHQTGGIIGGWVTAAKRARKVTIPGLVKLFLVIATIGAGLGAGVYLLAKGLKVALAELKPALQTPGDVVAMISLVTTMLVGSTLAANAAKAVKPTYMLKMSLVLVAVGAALAVGGVMLAKGVKQMVKELGGVSIVEMGKVMIGLAGFMALTVGVAAGAALVGKIGDPTSIAIGGLVIGVLGVFMVGLLVLIGGVVATMKKWGVSAQAMLAATKAMQALAMTMLIMIPVVLAATALGAAIVATSGVLAVAMAAGLQVIAAGVASLAAMAMSITKDLNNMKEAPGLERKAQVFTSVMGAINNMVSILAKIMKEMSPGLTDLVNVLRGGDIDSRIKSTTKFIEILLPEIRSIVKQVMTVIKDLSSGPDTMLKGAEIFANILQALGTFTQALVPPKELMEKKTVKYGILANEISTVTSSASNFTEKISGSVKEFMGQIIGFIKEITTLPISDEMLQQGIPAITNILRATAGLMSALVPDANTLQQFRETREASSKIGIMVDEHKNITKTLNVGALKNMLDSTKENFKELIKFLTNASFTKFLNDAAKVADNETKIKSLSAVGNIMGAIASVIQSLAKAGRQQSVGNIDASGEGANVIIRFPKTEGINTTLKELSKDQGGIAKMFNLIKKLSKGLSVDEKLQSDLEVLGKIFASIGDISKFMSTVSALSKGKKVAGVTEDALKKVVAPVKLLGSFIDQLAGSGSASISKIIDKVKTVSVGGEGSTAAIENMAKMTGVIKQADEMLGQVQRIAGRSFKKDIVEKGLVPALEAVGKMVESVNEMNKALSSVQAGKAKVEVGLRKVAGEMGVGGKANYSIRNNPINIHLAIQVEMQAAELERVIVFRKDSVIRDQLKWVRGSELREDKGPWTRDQADLDGPGKNYIRHTAN